MDLIPLFTFGIAAVVFLGAAVVYLRGSKDKGTIATLEKSNQALSENNKILNDRVSLLEASDVAKDARIDGLVQANEVLTNTVNSSELIANLATLITDLSENLTEHHKASMKGVATIHADLGSLPDRLGVVLLRPKGGSDGTAT